MSLRQNWDSANPSPAGKCALSPGQKGGEAHSPAAKGVGGPNSDDWKKLSTPPTLWTHVKGHADGLCFVVLQYIYLRVYMNNELHKENMCMVEE
jgi:hypothetical protein